MSRINAAIEALFHIPDPAEVSPTDPLRDLMMERDAMRIVGLAADLVGVIEEEGDSQAIRRRALRFRSLTEPGSRYDKLREAAYRRIVQEFTRLSGGADVDCLSVAQLRPSDKLAGLPAGLIEEFIEAAYVRKTRLLRLAPPEIELKRRIKAETLEELLSESKSDAPVARSDFDMFLASESIVWYPYEVEDYCWGLAWLLGYPELMALAVELVRLFMLITEFSLWGCFLLDAAHDTVLPTADAHRYGKLLETLTCSGTAFASILDLVDGFVAWQSDERHATLDDRNLLPVVSETPVTPMHEASETAETPKVEPSAYRFHFDERRKRWFLRFPGDEDCDFPECEGLKYYCRLLKYEGTPMDATTLTLTDERVIEKLGKREGVFGRKERDAYRNRIKQLDEQITSAKEAGDIGKIDKLEDERDRLEEQLGKDLDRYGEPHRLGPLVGDARIRHAAKRVMNYALDNIIGDTMPNLVKYLRAKFTLETNKYEWCYRNEEHIRWEF